MKKAVEKKEFLIDKEDMFIIVGMLFGTKLSMESVCLFSPEGEDTENVETDNISQNILDVLALVTSELEKEGLLSECKEYVRDRYGIEFDVSKEGQTTRKRPIFTLVK